MIQAQIMNLDNFKGEIKWFETYQEIENTLNEESRKHNKPFIAMIIKNGRIEYYAVTNSQGLIMYINR